MTRIAVRTAIALALTPALALAQDTDQRRTTPDDAPAAERPAYKPLRSDEHWGDFDPESGDDFWDPVKRVSLSDDASVYASFGGEFRVRAEDWQSFGFNSTNDDSFILTRVRLHTDIHFGRNFRVFVEGKSALATQRDLPGGRRTLDVDELDLQNAFADVRFPAGDDLAFTLRVGRQELLFGKQRLVSPLPWGNSLRTWDGIRLITEVARWRIDAFWTRYIANQKYEFNDWEPGSDFYGVYAAGKVGPADAPFDLDAYFLGLNRDAAAFNADTGEEDRFTLGARFGGAIPGTAFTFDLELAYQFGEVGSADVSAFSFASLIAYTFADCPWSPTLDLGFDYASGDDSPGDGDVETFNQLFPLGHAYLGFMDFIGRQNIIDLHAGLAVKPHAKFSLRVDAHFFWRASTDDAVYNAGGGVLRPGNLSNDAEIGQEIDLTAVFRADRHLTIQGGYSHFFAGDFISDSGPDDDVDWFYIQAVYRF